MAAVKKIEKTKDSKLELMKELDKGLEDMEAGRVELLSESLEWIRRTLGLHEV